MRHPILVTGAPGNVSSEIVRLLQEGGHRVRAAAVDPVKAQRALGDGVEYVPFNFGDAATYTDACEGVERLYLMRPPQITDVKGLIAPFIDHARAAGVRQIVFLSLMGVEKNPFVPHAKVEQCLKASGVAYTMLRPTYFMQNLSTTYREMIRQAGEIALPTARGKMSFIDARDIAAVAATCLTQPGHENKVYTLTGSEAYDYWEVARLFTEELGRPVTFTNASFGQYRRRMAALGMNQGLINVTTVMYLLARMGLSAGLTAETEQLLGRAPITMRQFIRDHAHLWS